ncbi:hypothetical protein ACIHIX_39495 [Streptomyces sp. NPDC051913]|uniref:hypothetical protein n=1 Tax=Streptomyces sp. NPDC051913 TaxID=3365676 RepID=UPI0037D1501C
MPADEDWLDRLLNLPRDYKEGSKSPLQLLEEANPPRLEKAGFTRLVTERLRRRPELIKDWQLYSDNRRTTPLLYMKEDGEVGVYDHGYTDVVRHDNKVDACADYVVRQTERLLEIAGG